MSEPTSLRPGMIVGILGGGQLGRMLAMAAAELGLSCHIYCPDPKSPAFAVAAARTIAPYDDEAALAAFAGARRSRHLRVREHPGRRPCASSRRRVAGPARCSAVARVAQDRLAEKRLIAGPRHPRVAPFAEVSTQAEIYSALGPHRPAGDPQDPAPRL